MPEIGQLVACTAGGWMVFPPQCCPNNHHLRANEVIVGHAGCGSCAGHTTWTCSTCDEIIYAPPLSVNCRVLTGPTG